jgi:hypothetical protein
VASPTDFLTLADNTDKEKVPKLPIILVVVGMAVLGLILSFVEYNMPLNTFRSEAVRLAKGQIDVLSPSRFRGLYKKIAADLNDGIEKVAAKGGAPRRAADLEQVLGPIPAQPQMSAFSVPGAGGPPPEPPSGPTRPMPRPPPGGSAPRLRSGQSGQMPAVVDAPAPVETPEEPVDLRPSAPTPPTGGRQPPAPPRRPTPGAGSPAVVVPAPAPAVVVPAPQAAGDGEFDEIADWRRVYEEFLSLKQQCGEDTGSLTFEKFKGTLQRNKDALVQRHGCARVKFTVYVKEGKAALKASPVK